MADDKELKLTAKQIRFCEEYVIDFNATQAAIRAGYSAKTAGQIGEQNLKKLEMQSRIKELTSALSEKTGITAEKVLTELALIGFYDVKEFINGGNTVLELKYLDEKTKAVAGIKTTSRAAISGEGKGKEIETTTEIKFHNKISALELIGRHIGMFEKDNSQKKPIVNITGMRVE